MSTTEAEPRRPTGTASSAQRGRLLDTLATHRRTLAQPWPRLRDTDGTYDARYAVEVARRLSYETITQLGEATDLREEGLAVARSGELEHGAALVARARERYESFKLPPEARVLAEWFQTPAEAYVEYRRGDTAAAEASLLRAIDACVPLRMTFGYRVQLRRVHLARNIIRVQDHDGRPLAALALAGRLLAYLERDDSAWPWPSNALAAPDELEADVRMLLLDQIIGDIARVLTTARPDACALLETADAQSWLAASVPAEPLEPARVWLAARSSAVRGEWDTFLTRATTFFSAPPGRLRMAWYELTGDLAQVTAMWAPDEHVSRAVD